MSEINETNGVTNVASKTGQTLVDNRPKPLTKEEHIKQYLTATGRPVVLERIDKATPFLKLAYGDGKGGFFPGKYSGTYTSPVQANQARLAFVLETWEVAEERTSKRVKIA